MLLINRNLEKLSLVKVHISVFIFLKIKEIVCFFFARIIYAKIVKRNGLKNFDKKFLQKISPFDALLNSKLKKPHTLRSLIKVYLFRCK